MRAGRSEAAFIAAGERMSPMSWLFFPLTLAGSFAVAYSLLSRGLDAGAVIGLSSLAAIAFIALCERLYPHRAQWNRSHDDVLTDVAHNVVTSYALRELLKLALAVTLAPWVARLAAAQGIGRIY